MSLCPACNINYQVPRVVGSWEQLPRPERGASSPRTRMRGRLGFMTEIRVRQVFIDQTGMGALSSSRVAYPFEPTGGHVHVKRPRATVRALETGGHVPVLSRSRAKRIPTLKRQCAFGGNSFKRTSRGSASRGDWSSGVTLPRLRTSSSSLGYYGAPPR